MIVQNKQHLFLLNILTYFYQKKTDTWTPNYLSFSFPCNDLAKIDLEQHELCPYKHLE